MIEMAGKSNVGFVRENNEDTFMVERFGDLDLMVVCDGLGGHNAGEVASLLTASMLINEFRIRPDGNIPDTIMRGIEAANSAVYEEGQLIPGYKGMASTITGVAFKDGLAYIFNVGDSRVYRLRGNSLEQLTEDDNEQTLALKFPKLYEDEIPGVGLTKTIGIYPYVEADIIVKHIHNGDKYLACSDGLFGFVREDMIASTLMISAPGLAVDHLNYLALRFGGNDNVTTIVAEAK